jgi:hypothetical protein
VSVVPIVSAAVCPHPPLLVPAVAAGAADELDELRAACLAAIDQLTAAHPDRLVIIGSGPLTGTRYAADTPGTFASYGAPAVRVGSTPPTAQADSAESRVWAGSVESDAPARSESLAGSESAESESLVEFESVAGSESLGGFVEQGLPLSLLIGMWLVEQSKAANVPRTAVTVAADETPTACAELGQELAAGNDRVALLVMGDGSARRSEHSPVHLHPRAELFDSTVAAALDLADCVTLAALDPDLATDLHAAGRAPWQVLAGAAASADLQGALTYHAAPYGVGYLVALWT